MEAIKHALLYSLWGAPVWAYLGIIGLGAVEYALPRVGSPKARSVGELVANALARILGRFPVLGPLLKILGTPQPAPSQLAQSAAEKAQSMRCSPIAVVLALAALTLVGGCQTAGAKAWKACELGKLPGVAQDAFATGLEIAENPNSVKEDLAAAALRYAPGQFECAMQALAAWLGGTAPSSGGDEIRAALLDAHTDVERAHARQVVQGYLAAHPATSCGDRLRG